MRIKDILELKFKYFEILDVRNTGTRTTSYCARIKNKITGEIQSIYGGTVEQVKDKILSKLVEQQKDIDLFAQKIQYLIDHHEIVLPIPVDRDIKDMMMF